MYSQVGYLTPFFSYKNWTGTMICQWISRTVAVNIMPYQGQPFGWFHRYANSRENSFTSLSNFVELKKFNRFQLPNFTIIPTDDEGIGRGTYVEQQGCHSISVDFDGGNILNGEL